MVASLERRHADRLGVGDKELVKRVEIRQIENFYQPVERNADITHADKKARTCGKVKAGRGDYIVEGMIVCCRASPFSNQT